MAECNRHGPWQPPEPAYPPETAACTECRREASKVAQAYTLKLFRWQHWERSSGLAGKEKTATFSNYSPTTSSQSKALQLMGRFSQALIDRGSGGVYLYGPQGAGKTHLAAATLTAAVKSGLLGHYHSWPALAESLRSSFSARTTCVEYESALSTPFLVVDFLSGGRWDPWEVQKFELLVDCRYRHCLPTIWISRCDPERLKAVTPMVESRFSCCAAPLQVDGPDYRASDDYFRDSRPPAFERPELPTIHLSYPEGIRTLSETEILWYSRIK